MHVGAMSVVVDPILRPDTIELGSLLADLVKQRYGAHLQRVVEILARQGASSLAAVAKALPELTESQLRMAFRIGMQHGVVGFSEESETFTLQYGIGLLPVVFPCVLRVIAELRPGDRLAPEMVLALLETCELTKDELLCRVSTERSSAAKSYDALHRTGIIIERHTDIVVEAELSHTDAENTTTRRGATKRPRPGNNNAAALPRCELHWPTIVDVMRAASIKRHFHLKYGPIAYRIVTAFLDRREKPAPRPLLSGGYRDLNELGFPILPDTLPKLDMDSIIKECVAPIENVHQVIEQLVNEGLLSRDSKTSSTHELFVLELQCVIRSMRGTLLDSMVASRHGVCGLRIKRLLEENKLMEDRHIADEALTTHADVRATLLEMLRNGIVRIIELPTSSFVSAERAGKNSIYLWELNNGFLTSIARQTTTKSLMNARAVLLKEVTEFKCLMPPLYDTDPKNAMLTPAQVEAAARFEPKKAALQRTFAALAERFVVMHYF